MPLVVTRDRVLVRFKPPTTLLVPTLLVDSMNALRVRRQNISVAPLVRTNPTEEYPTNAFKYFPSELRSLFVCEERLCIEGGGTIISVAGMQALRG